MFVSILTRALPANTDISTSHHNQPLSSYPSVEQIIRPCPGRANGSGNVDLAQQPSANSCNATT
jgi:hypothetical protein